MASYRSITFKLDATDLDLVHRQMAKDGYHPDETALNWYIKQRILDYARGTGTPTKVMTTADYPGA